MQLEKVVYLNIDVLPERVVAMEASFDACSVPLDCRERFIGIDARAYPSYAALLEAAPDIFQDSRLPDAHPEHWGAGNLAMSWGRYLLYQSLSELSSNACALVLHDNIHLVKQWHQYVQLAHDLREFDIVQLFHFDALSQPSIKEDMLWNNLMYWRRLTPLRSVPNRPDFCVGMPEMGDAALLVSASGARKIAEHFEIAPDQALICKFMWIPEVFGTCFSAKDSSAWVAHVIRGSYRNLANREVR